MSDTCDHSLWKILENIVCGKCGLTITPSDMKNAEISRLTSELAEANQAYHDLANEAQQKYTKYRNERDAAVAEKVTAVAECLKEIILHKVTRDSLASHVAVVEAWAMVAVAAGISVEDFECGCDPPSESDRLIVHLRNCIAAMEVKV